MHVIHSHDLLGPGHPWDNVCASRLCYTKGGVHCDEAVLLNQFLKIGLSLAMRFVLKGSIIGAKSCGFVSGVGGTDGFGFLVQGLENSYLLVSLPLPF